MSEPHWMPQLRREIREIRASRKAPTELEIGLSPVAHRQFWVECSDAPPADYDPGAEMTFMGVRIVRDEPPAWAISHGDPGFAEVRPRKPVTA